MYLLFIYWYVLSKQIVWTIEIIRTNAYFPFLHVSQNFEAQLVQFQLDLLWVVNCFFLPFFFFFYRLGRKTVIISRISTSFVPVICFVCLLHPVVEGRGTTIEFHAGKRYGKRKRAKMKQSSYRSCARATPDSRKSRPERLRGTPHGYCSQLDEPVAWSEKRRRFGRFRCRARFRWFKTSTRGQVRTGI